MFSGVLGIGFISYEGREWVQGEGENVIVDCFRCESLIQGGPLLKKEMLCLIVFVHYLKFALFVDSYIMYILFLFSSSNVFSCYVLPIILPLALSISILMHIKTT